MLWLAQQRIEREDGKETVSVAFSGGLVLVLFGLICGWMIVKVGMLTVFHVGCLLNKEDVQRVRAKPKFKVMFQVTYSISKPDLEWINMISRFGTIKYKVRTVLTNDSPSFSEDNIDI